MMFDMTEFKPFSLGYQGKKKPKPYHLFILKVGCCDLFKQSKSREDKFPVCLYEINVSLDSESLTGNAVRVFLEITKHSFTI